MANHRVPTVVIVDDAAEVRGLVKALLRGSDQFTVVGEGDDGGAAVALAEEHQPDLMLLDVSMPGMDGLEALPLVMTKSPTTKVVMFSGFAEQGLAQRTLELGAAAFLEKSTTLHSLPDHLLSVLPDASDSSRDEYGDPALDDPRLSGERHEESVVAEHLERFRELFDQAAIGMATLTLTGRIVRVNRALARLMDRPEDALIGLPYAALVAGPPTVLETALRDLRRDDVDLVPFEHDVTGTDPARRVQATMTPVRDSSGRPLYLFVQVQDVTTTRAAERRLQRSEERYRLLVSSVLDHAIFMLTPDGHIASWNAGAEHIKGYTADEAVGQHFRMFYPEDKQAERHPEHELELALRDGHYEEEGWRVRKDGSQFWANVVITPVIDGSGRHVGFSKVTRDQTERRSADEELRQSEERFRLLVQAVQDYAIFMLDPDGYIASWNAGAQRSKGYAADEIIGQHFRIFYPADKQVERHPEHELELAVRHGHYEEEGWRVRKDGSLFWASVTITAIFNDNGRHVGFAKVTRDQSERRELLRQQDAAARALAEANTELAAANERLRLAADDQAQFLAVTAHELRSPVTVLGGSADTLSQHWEQLTQDERNELLAGMASSSSRLRRLLADLLTASRLQSSALELHVAAVDVAEVLSTSAAAARRTFPASEVIVTAPPGVTVLADRDRLAQAVDNLVANGLRHGASPVHVDVVADAAIVEVRVTDSGSGVRTEMQPRLFDRFATGKSRGGTGLGLFIVRELARAQQGDAHYEGGTADRPAGTFVLTLPRGASMPG